MRSATLADPGKDRLADHLRLAEQLGGEAVTIPGQDVARDILRYARTSKLHACRRRHVGQGALARAVRGIGFARPDPSCRRHLHPRHFRRRSHDRTGKGRPHRTSRQSIRLKPYLVSTLYVASALAVSGALNSFLDVRNLGLVFLIAVLASAITSGCGRLFMPALPVRSPSTSFFLEPRHTLTISDPESVVALVIFLIVANDRSNLAARLHRQTAAAARQRARTTDNLYQFSRKLAGTGTLDDVLWATAYQIAAMLRLRVVVLMPDGDTLAVKVGYPPDDTLSTQRYRRRPLGLGARTARRARVPTPCPAPSGSTCLSARAGRRSASSVSTMTSPARC